ncbi:hypothetical protein F3Y22_tig00117016pilonHSYRG00171 [Hibiscus syriacus]|uniref:Uncharacterized protein n=1 Tax=Hibiscus syriacus TaxID=106335 RepID=A0A6A2WD82_HIBSY|nr:hypothetical protein F3Y22_tig00117016pilonHSYRG00171 [Hibiscus syriacus]
MTMGKAYEELGEVKVENEKLRVDLKSEAELCQNLKKILNELHLNAAANDKMRVERDEKNQKWEQESRGLVLALDEANENNVDLEQIFNVLRAENKGLKVHLSVSQNKCSMAEKKAKNPKELKDTDLFAKVDEGRWKVEDQLKWKKEEFKHLEEAHDKLREKFEISKNEWE